MLGLRKMVTVQDCCEWTAWDGNSTGLCILDYAGRAVLCSLECAGTARDGSYVGLLCLDCAACTALDELDVCGCAGKLTDCARFVLLCSCAGRDCWAGGYFDSSGC